MPKLDDPITLSARRIAERGGQAALAGFRRLTEIEDKGEGAGFDPVTAWDRAAERAMRDAIQAAHPDHAVLGEEEGASPGNGQARWVLDPIDGTRGFICGTPTWTTLVGFEERGRAVVGVIHQPFTGETWVGAEDGARAHSSNPSADAPPVTLRCSRCTELSAARLSTTDPRPPPFGYFSEDEAAAFAGLARRTQVARFGMDAYAYALLASGHLDLVVETGLQRYDVAALIPIVRGAGGVISDWSGGPADGAGRIIAAASPELHARAVELLTEPGGSR